MTIIWMVLAVVNFICSFFCAIPIMLVGVFFGIINLMVCGVFVYTYIMDAKIKRDGMQLQEKE